uniref:Trehalase n=1 Tax=Gouania willdenowi TaxID=441366 RepID=A0A8C5N959_GOUWI
MDVRYLLLFFLFNAALDSYVNGAIPPCDSEIYCTGPILHQVQKAKLYDDDKYFVDMKLREAPDVVLAAFRNLTMEWPNATVPPVQLQQFLSSYFEKPGTEFEEWTPPDWHDKPSFLEGITDGKLRLWAEKIHQLWKQLGRKVMSNHPELYSQIYTPHPVVVPGGRFRELYYWDSYWVINGLLLSEMRDTAHGMIQNFLYLVNRYGFIPNGGRIYYERRSQPPFLTLMVESISRHTLIPHSNTHVSGTLHVLNHYYVHVGLPRPESYTDDLELAEGLSDEQTEQLWMDLKSGAESGWDFSSRWYVSDHGPNNTLKDTRTSHFVPSDLNALLCRNEKTLASFHRLDSATLYEQAAARRMEAMEALLWDDERGAWFDFNLLTHTKNIEFYPSNLAPVWAQCYSTAEMGEKAVQYLKTSGGLQFPNGVPTSLSQSGQQWDYPNAWPPLQHMLIHGFSKLESEDAQELAFDLAQRWIGTNWLAYEKYEAMFEKYDVNGDGKPGGGGEYEVQLGFGWTNGVALQLLDQYGSRLTSGSRGLCSGFLLPLLISADLVFL